MFLLCTCAYAFNRAATEHWDNRCEQEKGESKENLIAMRSFAHFSRAMAWCGGVLAVTYVIVQVRAIIQE